MQFEHRFGGFAFLLRENRNDLATSCMHGRRKPSASSLSADLLAVIRVAKVSGGGKLRGHLADTLVEKNNGATVIPTTSTSHRRIPIDRDEPGDLPHTPKHPRRPIVKQRLYRGDLPVYPLRDEPDLGGSRAIELAARMAAPGVFEHA